MTSNKSYEVFALTFDTSPIRGLYTMESQKDLIQLIFRDATTSVGYHDLNCKVTAVPQPVRFLKGLTDNRDRASRGVFHWIYCEYVIVG